MVRMLSRNSYCRVLEYYVYAYLRSDGTPYYIGKGKNNRAFSKNHGVGLPPRHRIVFLERNLTNLGACAIERRLIKWYGRKIDGGILRNTSLGGEGNTAPRSEHHRAQLREANLGKTLSEETRQKMSLSKIGKPTRARTQAERDHLSQLNKGKRGTPHTEQAKQAIRAARLGTKHSQQTKENLRSKSQRGKTWVLIDNKRVWITG